MDDTFFNFLILLVAPGLFLHGMKVMSDALMEPAGGRMRKILARQIPGYRERCRAGDGKLTGQYKKISSKR